MFSRAPRLLFSLAASAAAVSVALSPPKRNMQSHAALNSILSTIELNLPDKQFSTNGIDIEITELVCTEISLQDVDIVHSIVSKQTQRINLALEGVRAICNFRWNYQWTFFGGEGTGTAEIGDNSRIAAALDFISRDYDFHPPKDVNIAYCQKDGIKVVDMVFEGDGLGSIGGLLNSFEESLRGTVNEEVGEEVCEEMIELSDDALEEVLLTISKQIEPYLVQSTSTSIQDPLYLENSSTEIPTNEDGLSIFVDFQELDKYANGMVKTAFDKLDGMIGSRGSNGELAVNTIIRENVLNKDGMLELDRTLFSTSGVMFEVRDELMETIMTIESIHVGGLDSFQSLDLMNAIGKHTLQNSVKLEKLSFIIEVEAIMK